MKRFSYAFFVKLGIVALGVFAFHPTFAQTDAEFFGMQTSQTTAQIHEDNGQNNETSDEVFIDERSNEELAEDPDVGEFPRKDDANGDASPLRFLILASRDSTDPDEQQAIEYAAREENKNVAVISLDETQLKGDGGGGVEWLPVDPSQEDAVAREDLVTRPSQVRLAATEDAIPNLDVLALTLDPAYSVEGEHFEDVREGMGLLGEPLAQFTMTAEGAQHMERLTDRYRAGEGRVGRRLGVVFSGRLFNAPTIQSTIGKNGQITFGNSRSAEDYQRIRREVKKLLAVLSAADAQTESASSP